MKRLLQALALALALASAAARAGQACENRPLDADAARRGLDLAERSAERLDASGAEVVVIARAGQDLRRYGLRWSHLGFAYRERVDASGRGIWRVVHKLNQCGSALAAVYRQGLGEFFLDRPWRYEAAFVVLAPAVQRSLAPLLRDDRRATQWHSAPYSLVAYPWAERYQQSNQWAIETLAGALEPNARTRRLAQAWLQLHDYRPATLRLDALTRLGARIGSANIAFDDHPGTQRFADRIDTVSADSVLEWLARSGLGGAAIELH
jgi:hypothetical protein